MLEALDAAVSWGGRHQADRLAGQGSIFDLGGGGEEEARPQQHPPIPPGEYEKNDLLRLEKETLGVYVSEHPLQAIREQLRRKTECGLAELEQRRDGEVVTVGGIVGAIKQLTTKKGEPMVFMRLDDLTGSTEVVVFNSVYAAARELLELDTVLVVKGRVDHKQEGETKLIALEVSAFEATPERREVTLKVDATRAPAGIVRELAGLVREYPGEIPVIVALTMSAGREDAAAGAGLPGQARAGLLRRGEVAPRRGRDSLKAMQAVLTDADVEYIRANFVPLDELCATRGQSADRVRALIAAGSLPAASYVLEDGTEMVPAEYFELIDEAGGEGALRGLFARRYVEAARRSRRGRLGVGGLPLRRLRGVPEARDAGEHRAQVGARRRDRGATRRA